MKSLALACAIAVFVLAFLSTYAVGQKRRGPVRPDPQRAVTNCPKSGLTDVEVAELLAAHNKVRQKVRTSPLVWDCRLGSAAAAWVARGTFGHSGTSFGENIFVSSDSNDKVTKAADRWEDEDHNWNNKTATCESGKTCTHYTQMVWRTTTKIGCAINRQGSGKWKLMLVCNYDPAALGDSPAY
jgi:uncharacterized protein YkwD